VSINKWSFCLISALALWNAEPIPLGYDQKIILGISNICLRFFFACLDLRQKSSFPDGHKETQIAAMKNIQSIKRPKI